MKEKKWTIALFTNLEEKGSVKGVIIVQIVRRCTGGGGTQNVRKIKKGMKKNLTFYAG